MSRASLAALLAEVVLPVADGGSAVTSVADVAIFPGTKRISGLPGRSRSVKKLPALFANAKAAYLVERSFEQYEISSLVFCSDAENQAGNAFAPAVSQWVEITHGSEPKARERLGAGLFVVAATGSEGTERPPVEGELLDMVRRELAPGQDWLDEWTPARPFENIILHKWRDKRKSTAGHGREIQQSDAQGNFEIARHDGGE
jgi:hypothetical protein